MFWWNTQEEQARRWKAEGFEHYLTIGEMATRVGVNVKRIVRLEQKGRLPSPIRVKHGRHMVRLYSPAEAKLIEEHFAKTAEHRRKLERTKRSRRQT